MRLKGNSGRWCRIPTDSDLLIPPTSSVCQCLEHSLGPEHRCRVNTERFVLPKSPPVCDGRRTTYRVPQHSPDMAGPKVEGWVVGYIRSAVNRPSSTDVTGRLIGGLSFVSGLHKGPMGKGKAETPICHVCCVLKTGAAQGVRVPSG